MMTQTDNDSDDLFDGMRNRALDAVLANVAFDGWSRRSIAAAAEKLALPAGEIDRLFPDGVVQMIAYHSRRADREMVAAMEAQGTAGMKIRDRIRTAIRVRLEANAAHREAIRHALVVLATPAAGTLGVRLLYRTVDAMWYAAGDTSTDFSFYTKRALLAGVYSSTVFYWLNDRSPDGADTWAFLDRRIADVMRIPRLTEPLRRAARFMPDPFRLFRGFDVRR